MSMALSLGGRKGNRHLKIFVFNIYLFLRNRERESMSRGGAQRKKERQRQRQHVKQVSGSELSEQSLTWGLNPKTVRS